MPQAHNSEAIVARRTVDRRCGRQRIRALANEEIIPDDPALMKAINAQRNSPLRPLERPGQGTGVRSRRLTKRRRVNDAG